MYEITLPKITNIIELGTKLRLTTDKYARVAINDRWQKKYGMQTSRAKGENVIKIIRVSLLDRRVIVMRGSVQQRKHQKLVNTAVDNFVLHILCEVE